MVRIVVAACSLCALVLLAACATTGALEPQTKALDTRQSRLYFVRESSFLYSGGAPNVLVDGQEVGRLGNGSSFFVDRPPGPHQVVLETPLNPGRYAATVTTKPGGVYYLKIGPRGDHLAIGIIAGLAGQIIDAAVSENSGPYTLTPVDEATGAALLAQVKEKDKP
ncbi:DUF2846 domain-containing protein [Rhodoplanes sp. TEM]|uniref:DUF2846 domain-containing protein n=1 Tax=Rhodoplanes tepidamans TaxID=200616 RepID=A0ABT5JD19_RHOTP|nr:MULTISPECIES: DUF2846 domain-containing protein [Rhodoplanes]MDC7787251.1 DUF2846 domain-containing protein [Rhodoplanes tepidamans]MDC7985279.1 DUF2846 domain-containing protein [Rhodoplanes sp. TEM]MDQ0357786.1 hypothetical protein [Rhodoplanes tepidamans]